MKILFSIACAAFSLGAGSAQSAIVTQSFSLATTPFTSSSFLPQFPYTAFTGKFRISFDNSSSITKSKAGLTISGFNGARDFDLSYAYDKGTDSFTIATSPEPYRCLLSDTSFCFFVPNASTTLKSDGVTTDRIYYSLPGAYGVSQNYAATRAILQTTAVPEPSMWMLFLGGFSLLGASMRRRPLAPRRA